MDNRNKETCKFCLKIIYDNNFDIIGEVARQMLDALLLKLNLSREESVMCLECATKLQNAVDFKTACLNAETKISSEAKGELVAREVNCKKNTNGVSEDQKVCRFCMNKVESGSCTDLQERKEYIFLLDMIQKYIPELCLNVAQEVVTCETCHASLQNLLSFITDCLQNEENVKEGMDTTEVKDELELNQDFTMIYKASGSAAVVEKNCDSNADVIVKDEIEEEDPLKIDNVDMDIKHEEMEIKSEENDSESFEVTVPSSALKNEIESEITRQINFDEHIETHENTSGITSYNHDVKYRTRKNSSKKMYKCERCLFETSYKKSLERHTLIHQDLSERSFYRCSKCTFRTAYKVSLRKHVLTHRDHSELLGYKCEKCLYVTNRIGDLNVHLLIHQNSSEATVYKCTECSFDTRSKRSLKRHVLAHQGIKYKRRPKKHIQDHSIYRCASCSFETNHKRNLKQHVLVHQDLSKVKMFKCQFCPYCTRYKSVVTRHILTHKDLSEVKMYKCRICRFETKHQESLKRHHLIHQDPLYKCEKCSYTARYKNIFKVHMLTHQDLSEVTCYECERCSYKTNCKSTLKIHKLSHKDLSEVTFYECEKCLYKSKRKTGLKNHMLTHQEPSEVTWHKCESCSFTTKRIIYLKKHITQMHGNAS